MNGERMTVFIVDDNEEFVASIGEFIKRKRYSLESAGSVKEALLKLQEVVPDLSFVDLLLKDGEGIDVVRKIKDKNPKSYAVMLSGHREDIASKKSHDCGADEYIPKPLTISCFKAVLDKFK